MKAAVAAALAWLAVQPAGGFADDYPYYAPLGAVIVMSTTVVTSVRNAAQALGAIALGASLSLVVRAVPVPEVMAIALVVGVGTVVSGWRRLGTQSGYVPVTGLFVLIVGGTDPWPYVFAYGGLTAVGAAVAVGVNAVWPQLPLTPATTAHAALRMEVARQVEQLADALERPTPLDQAEWAEIGRSMGPERRRVETLLSEAMESRRGNWRAGRWATVLQQRYDRAQALDRMSAAVEETATLLADPQMVVHADDGDARALRTDVATALRAVGSVLRSVEESADEEADPEAARDAVDAVSRLRSTTLSIPSESADHLLAGAGIVLALGRITEAWAAPAAQ